MAMQPLLLGSQAESLVGRRKRAALTSDEQERVLVKYGVSRSGAKPV